MGKKFCTAKKSEYEIHFSYIYICSVPNKMRPNDIVGKKRGKENLQYHSEIARRENRGCLSEALTREYRQKTKFMRASVLPYLQSVP